MPVVDLEGSLSFVSLAEHFLSAILIFTLARFGGVPVPIATRVGTVFWGVFMTMQGLQYLIVLLSIVMDVFAFLALRGRMAPCLVRFGGHGMATIDLAGLATAMSTPDVMGRFMVLFIDGYVLSTGLKVWVHASIFFKGRLATSKADEEPMVQKGEGSLAKQFKKELPNTTQPFRFASVHYWVAYAGLVFAVALVLACLAIIPAIAFLPVTLALAALIRGLFHLVPVLEENFPLTQEVEDKDGHVRTESRLRNTTGWFTDLSMIQPKLAITLRFPQQFLDPNFRSASIGDEFWKAGGGDSDAGFLTLAYGLQIFLLCLALSPIICYGLWITIAFESGSISAAEVSFPTPARPPCP